MFRQSNRRFRPFIGLRNTFHYSENQGMAFYPVYDAANSSSIQYQAVFIKGSTLIEHIQLEFGAYFKLSNRIWTDITIAAPTGHSLPAYSHTKFEQAATSSTPLYNSSYSSTKVYEDTYRAILPNVQLGISYQIK